MSKYTDEQRLQVFAKFECGEDTRDIVEILGIPYPTVLRWKADWKEAKLNGNIQSLVDVDSMLIHRVAQELKYDLNLLEGIRKEPVAIEPVAIELVAIEQEPITIEQELELPTESEVPAIIFKSSLPESVFATEIANMVDKVDSYQMLNKAMHSTALKLVSKISTLSDKETIGPLELGTLVESLARIQVAFFNKNSTNVNILNQQVVSEKEVTTFKAFKKA